MKTHEISTDLGVNSTRVAGISAHLAGISSGAVRISICMAKNDAKTRSISTDAHTRGTRSSDYYAECTPASRRVTLTAPGVVGAGRFEAALAVARGAAAAAEERGQRAAAKTPPAHARE